MNRISLAFVATLLLSAAAPHAVVVEIPLPELIGTHNGAESTVPVTLPGPPTAINSVSFRFVSTAEVGVIRCPDVWGIDQDGPWPTGASVFLHDGGYSQYWSEGEGGPYVAGDFSWTKALDPYPHDYTLGFLLDGSGFVTLYAGASGYVAMCSEVSAPPTVTVTEAVLIVDGDFPISVETTTWGKVKALYR